MSPNEAEPVSPAEEYLLRDLERSLRNVTFPVNRQFKPQMIVDDKDGAERALRLLRSWQQDTLVPQQAYEIVMRGFQKRGRSRWTYQGETICTADMNWQLYLEAPQKTLESASITLQTLATCASPRNAVYAQYAQHILDDFHEPPLAFHFYLLHAYAWEQPNKRPPDKAELAWEIYHTQGLNEDPSLRPKSLQLLLEAYSKSTKSTKKCEAIFHLLQQDEVVQANDYMNLILAHCKEGSLFATERAYELLHEHPGLTSIAWNAVLASYGKLKDFDRLLETLDELEHHDFAIPTTVTYNSVLYSLLTHPNRNRALELVEEVMERMNEPNAFTYHTLLKAVKQSRDPDVARIQSLIDRVEDLCLHEKDTSLHLAAPVYNVALSSYTKTGNTELALDLLDRMRGLPKRCHPDIMSYTIVLEGLARSGFPDAIELAMELLDEVKSEHQSGNILAPSVRTYTMVIQTIANHQGDARIAFDLLREMESLHPETLSENGKRNTYPYNYVILAAANSLIDKEEAFRMAMLTYRDLGVSRDSFSYAFWIKCCIKLLRFGELRNKCIRQSFDECCSRGLLNDNILQRVIQGLPPSLVESVIGNNVPKTTKEVPREWSENSMSVKWQFDIEPN